MSTRKGPRARLVANRKAALRQAALKSERQAQADAIAMSECLTVVRA